MMDPPLHLQPLDISQEGLAEFRCPPKDNL